MNYEAGKAIGRVVYTYKQLPPRGHLLSGAGDGFKIKGIKPHIEGSVGEVVMEGNLIPEEPLTDKEIDALGHKIKRWEKAPVIKESPLVQTLLKEGIINSEGKVIQPQIASK